MSIYKIFLASALLLVNSIVSAANCDLLEADKQPEILRNLNITGYYQPDDRFDGKIRCAIVANQLYTPKLRHIEVYLDDETFSEKNLISLFKTLSNAFPEPKMLTVEVTTNRAEAFPLIHPGRGSGNAIGSSSQPDKPDRYDHYQAIYYRRERKGVTKYFEYNPVLKTSDFKTVVMERKD